MLLKKGGKKTSFDEQAFANSTPPKIVSFTACQMLVIDIYKSISRCFLMYLFVHWAFKRFF